MPTFVFSPNHDELSQGQGYVFLPPYDFPMVWGHFIYTLSTLENYHFVIPWVINISTKSQEPPAVPFLKTT